MQVNRAGVAEQFFGSDQDYLHPAKVLVLAHLVGIGGQLDASLSRGQLDVKHVARAERRVEVDHLHLAGVIGKQRFQRVFRARKQKQPGTAAVMQLLGAGNAHDCASDLNG